MLNTLKDIWFLITEAEYYLRFEVLKSVEDSVNRGDTHLNLDREKILLVYKTIEQKSILVNPTLGKTALTFFQYNIVNTYHESIEEFNLTIVQVRGLEGALSLIQSQLGDNYLGIKQDLRHEFGAKASKILDNL